MDDLIEIKQNALDREALRLNLLTMRLQQFNVSQLPLTEKIILDTVKRIKCHDIDEAELGKILKKLSGGLKTQYRQLSQIIRRLS